MAFAIISILNVVGCLIIAFYFGWKLTLVTLCSAMPLIFGAAFFRIRYETKFEEMNNQVFAESAKFATESIGAFRTVSALTLEHTICSRYEKLLRDHTKNAFGKASWTTLVFAMADSISILCMAFVLWYGGNLMLNHEYWPFQYILVYVAVLQVSASPPSPGVKELSTDPDQRVAWALEHGSALDLVSRLRPILPAS